MATKCVICKEWDCLHYDSIDQIVENYENDIDKHIDCVRDRIEKSVENHYKMVAYNKLKREEADRPKGA